jgi:CheY-like chemotaxis protein
VQSRILYKNVLLADDDEDDFLFFRDILKDFGDPMLYHANDGEHLLRMLASGVNPDIIFLDINMPRLNGFQCLKEIRKMIRFNDVPIVIMSTYQDLSVIDSLYTAGANLYINKPNNFQELKNIVQDALSRDYSKKKKFLRKYVDSVL